MSYMDDTDTSTYSGIFVRQVLGQAPPPAASSGSCSCPDIIIDPTLPNPVPTPTTYTTPASYATQPPNDVNLNNPNYVYIRGIQCNGYTGGTNFFLYYTQSNLALWPQNWSDFQITVGSIIPPGSPQNWAYAASPGPGSGQILQVEQPLIWTPPNIDTGVMHYCAICWADNSTESNPVPPDFSTLGGMASFNDLMAFLAMNPNMGWLNTTDHPTPPPGDTYQVNVSTQASAETVNITVSFYNITQGTFTINLVGDVTWTSGSLNVANYQGGYILPSQSFPANASSTLQVIYTPPSGTMPPLARIIANIVYIISPMSMEFLEPILALPNASLPIKKMRLMMPEGRLGDVEDVFLLGSQTWNLNF
jgi:hypothetical protein